MKQWIKYLALLALVALTGCVSASVMPSGSKKFPPLPETTPVNIYYSENEVHTPFEVVGIISYTNPGKYQILSLGDVAEDLRRQARKAGGNGIVVQQTRTVKSGIFSTG